MAGDSGRSTSNEGGKPQSTAEWVVLAIETGLFVGMIPPRVATLATLWGIPLTLLLSSVAGGVPFLLILVALWLVGIPICGRAAQIVGQDDPREVTYDEFATLPLVYFLAPELTWQVLCAGFALHRFFDILKPLGIKRLEKLPAGLGIMADDVLASLYALLCMHLRFCELNYLRKAMIRISFGTNGRCDLLIVTQYSNSDCTQSERQAFIHVYEG